MNSKTLKISALIISIALFSPACGNETNKSVNKITIKGKAFRDLNKNGILDAYEDWRLSVEKRIDDLMSKMTLEEKVGLMFPIILNIGTNGELVEEVKPGNHIKTSEAVLARKINHVYIYSPGPPRVIARWSNNIQKLAEQTGLGIPVTVCTDPRYSINRPYNINNYHTQGFNKDIITGILRNRLYYDGVVCTNYITISPDECNTSV